MAERELKIDADKFPSNSYAERDKKKVSDDISSEPQEARVKSVGKAKVKKQGLIKKLARSIVEDSIDNVKERAYNEIVVPGIKSLLFDTVVDMADAIIFGSSGSGYSRGYSRRVGSSRRRDDHVSYDKYYEEKNRRNSVSQRGRRGSRNPDIAMEPDDIILPSRQMAKKALDEVANCIDKYGHASIADLYDAVELTSDWTDAQYGWDDIRQARIRPVRGGFMLIMPPTIELD